MASNRRRPDTEPRYLNASSRVPNTMSAEVYYNNWVGASSARPAKKDNPERAREATLSRDSTPAAAGGGKSHTPYSYPRTKQAAHMRALERIRQTLQFNDEQTSGTENEDGIDLVSVNSDDQSQDSGVQDATPDSNQIVGRLMQIRDYLKQATNIMESLDKDMPNSQDQFGRINKLIQHLKEQEEGYLALLQKMLADRSGAGSEVLNNQRDLAAFSSRSPPRLTNGDAAALMSTLSGAGGTLSLSAGAVGQVGTQQLDDDENGEGLDDDVSIDVETASEVSINTDRTWNAFTRPNIESHMGFHSDMSSIPNSATGSTGSGESRQSSTVGALTDSSLNRTLTNDNLGTRLTSGPRQVQSNVDLFISDEVDGDFHHADSPAHSSGSKSRNDAHKSKSLNLNRILKKSNGRLSANRPPGSPRLKQTNLPIRSITNQPFDELLGVEFVEQESVMSSSDGFDILTVSGESDRVTAVVSDTDLTPGEQSDKEAEVNALRKQRDLLKKMLDQQRMLKALHERQAELLDLQQRADESEQDDSNPTPNNTLKVSNISAAARSGRGLSTQNGRGYDEDKDEDENEQDGAADDDEEDDEESSESEAETEDLEIVSVDEGGYADPPPTREGEPEVPAELQALRERLLHLKSVFDENLSNQMDDQQRLDTLRQMQSTMSNAQQQSVDMASLIEPRDSIAEGADSLAEGGDSLTDGEDSETSTNPERRQLSNKLRELQDKRSQMEHLLGELQTLREYRKHNDDGTASESTVTGRVIRDRQEQTSSAGVTAGQAETVLDVMEQESKLRKLEEVRGRLDQLRDLVQYYQAGNYFIHDDNSQTVTDLDQSESEASAQVFQHYSVALAGAGAPALAGRQQAPPSVSESEVGDEEDMSLNGNLRSLVKATRVRENQTRSISEDTSDLDSNISVGDFGNDPEIQEKVRKLNSARERLARLQALVGMVQQWPESAEVLPEDLAELAASAMDDTASECESTVSKVSTTSGAQSFSDLYEQSRQKSPPRTRKSPKQANQNSAGSRAANQKLGQLAAANRNASNAAAAEESDVQSQAGTVDSRAESEVFYLQRMEEQKLELKTLMEEKEKLMRVQQELRSLHQQYTDTTPEAIQSLLQGVAANNANTASSSARNMKSLPNNKGGSARTGVTFSAKLPETVDSDPANDDLYTRMMEQKMKRQENRKSKDEDQMTADVTTLGTWGDSEDSPSSSSGSEDDESEDNSEDTPADEREIDEQDDGYPSDGLLQVEEEEEAYQESDRGTYTVEDEYELRQRYPINVRSRPSRQRSRPHTHTLREAGNPAAGDYYESKRALVSANTRSAGARGAAVTSGSLSAQPGSGTDMISTMKDQLDATTEMCQHLLQEQRKLSLKLSGDYQSQQQSSAAGSSRGGGEPWQENRIVYSINQLFSQVMDMQAALQVTVDQVYAITQHLDSTSTTTTAGLESSSATLRPDAVARGSNLAGLPVGSSRSGLPTWARPTAGWTPRPDPIQGLRNYDARNYTRASQIGGDVTTDQSQSEGEITPTNYRAAHIEGAVGGLQMSGRSNATSEHDSKTESARYPSSAAAMEHNYSIPPLDLDKLIKRRQQQSRSLQSSGRSYPSPSLSAIAAGRVQIPLDSMYRPGISSGIAGTSYADNTSVSSAVSSVRGGHTPLGAAAAATLDTPTKTLTAAATSLANAAVAAYKDGVDRESAASDYSLFEALRETIYSEVATLISQNENRPHFLIELFRELQMLSSDYLRQRGLYSIQELVTKFLTEDVASIKLDTDAESDCDILAPQPAWMLYRTTGSEQTPSESCVTTDEEEVRQMLGAQHSMTPVSSSAALHQSTLQRVGSIKSDFADYIEQVETTSTLSTAHSQQSGSGWEDPFNRDSLGDTVIHLEQAMHNDRRGNQLAMASLPVPSSTSLASTTIKYGSESGASDISHDFPFACDSPLGDTAIDLQEAMQKVKDIDARKAAKQDSRSPSSSSSAARRGGQEGDNSYRRSQAAGAGGAAGSAVSEGSSSSAHDAGSDIDDQSTTDMQMTRIDTQQLDRQIKQIMTEIIPVLREHMDNVCSSQLLEYIQQRVIELTIQTDGDRSKPDRAVEFAQFFQKQLSNILRDSLAKFEGRKMRDCGEEVLVDISEILFNELAFFKLMQDLDDPDMKDKLAQTKWRVCGGGAEGGRESVGRAGRNNGETDTEVSSTTADLEMTAEEDEVISETDPDEESAQGETSEDEERSQPGVTGQDNTQTDEVENLGKARDDAFADEVNTRDESGSVASFRDIHFELAPSETKPMTRIGSDEDFSGDDDTSSELSTDEEDDTAISRQTAEDQTTDELNTDDKTTDDPTTDNKTTDGLTTENKEPADDANEDDLEIGIDDLPSRLNVDTDAIDSQAAKEQKTNQSAVSECVDLDHHELAGSGTELKPPPTAAEQTNTQTNGEQADDVKEKTDDNTEKPDTEV